MTVYRMAVGSDGRTDWHMCDGHGGLRCHHGSNSSSTASSGTTTDSTGTAPEGTPSSAAASVASSANSIGAHVVSSMQTYHGVQVNRVIALHTDWITQIRY